MPNYMNFSDLTSFSVPDHDEAKTLDLSKFLMSLEEYKAEHGERWRSFMESGPGITNEAWASLISNIGERDGCFVGELSTEGSNYFNVKEGFIIVNPKTKVSAILSKGGVLIMATKDEKVKSELAEEKPGDAGTFFGSNQPDPIDSQLKGSPELWSKSLEDFIGAAEKFRWDYSSIYEIVDSTVKTVKGMLEVK